MPWATRGAMAVTRGQFGMLLPELNGLLWAVGGAFATAAASNRLNTDAYDPATGTWTAKAAAPEALRGHATAAGGGFLWTFGGISTADIQIDRIHRYNPATNTWDTAAGTAVLPLTRHSLTAIPHPDGRIFLLGGEDINGLANYVDSFNPATLAITRVNTIQPTDSAYNQLDRFTAAAILNGVLYTYRLQFNSLDLSTGVWTFRSGAPGSMTSGPVLLPYFGGLVLLGGGATAATRVWYYRFDPLTQTWTRLTDMPVQRTFAAAGVASATGALIVAGGGSNGSTSTFVNSTSEWTAPPVDLPAIELAVGFALSTYADSAVDAAAAIDIEVTTAKRLTRYSVAGVRSGRIHPVPYPSDELYPNDALYPGG